MNRNFLIEVFPAVNRHQQVCDQAAEQAVSAPQEFKQFIGSDMRIQQVRTDNLSEVGRVLEFYMGKNTPDHRQYIMDHLTLRPV